MRTYAVWERRLSILILLSIVYVMGTFGAYFFTIRFDTAISISTLLLLHRYSVPDHAIFSAANNDVFQTGCLISFTDRIGWISQIVLLPMETRKYLLWQSTRQPKSAFCDIPVSLSLLLIKALVYCKCIFEAIFRPGCQ